MFSASFFAETLYRILLWSPSILIWDFLEPSFQSQFLYKLLLKSFPQTVSSDMDRTENFVDNVYLCCNGYLHVSNIFLIMRNSVQHQKYIQSRYENHERLGFISWLDRHCWIISGSAYNIVHSSSDSVLPVYTVNIDTIGYQTEMFYYFPILNICMLCTFQSS